MHFRLYALIGALFLISCGPPHLNDDNGKEVELGFFTTASQAALTVGDDVVFIDADFQAILRFKNDPLSFLSSVDIPYDAIKQSFMAASEGRYYLTFKKDEFRSISADGVTHTPEFLVDEDLTNVAFAPEHDLLLVWDDLGVVAAQLSASGEFESSFRGDANFGLDQAFISSTMLNDGQLVASFGEATLALIDIPESIKKKKWQTTTFELTDSAGGTRDAKSMTWLAATPFDDDLVLVKDSDRLIVVNVTTKSVVNEVDLSSSADTRVHRASIPHLLTTDSLTSGSSKTRPYNLHYIDEDGTLTKSIISNVKDGFLDSALDTSGRVVTIRVGEETVKDNENKQQERVVSKFEGSIYRYNIDTGGVVDKSDIEDEVRVHMTPDRVFLHFDSPLGKLQKRSYGSGKDQEEIKHFNLSTLQRRHK